VLALDESAAHTLSKDKAAPVADRAIAAADPLDFRVAL
jgi:hypothetical protein